MSAKYGFLPVTLALLCVAAPGLAQDRGVATPVTRAATVVSPIAPTSPVSRDRAVQAFSGGAQIQLASASSSASGLPRPSIILGVIAQERSFDTAPVTTTAEPDEIAWDNLAARQAMRGQDPELYARLVSTGAFDPPEAALTRALQTEMARMNCYNAGVDGDWGPGSRRSVARYVEAGGEDPGDDTATIFLWRHVIAAEDVACPDVVVARPARVAPATTARRNTATTTRTTTRRATPTRTTQTRTAPAATPPAATSTTRGIRGGLGAGVVR